MAKTELFARHQPGGVFTVVDEGFSTGNRFFVNSATGTDAVGYGNNPDAPFDTIDYAVGQCTASNGDIIYVMPGHTETITAAAGLDLDVAGIRIIGLGQGRNRPKIEFTTATTADMDVDAANITLENFYIDCTGVDAVAAAIDVNAADFTLRNCEIELADATGQCTIGILADANADRMRIENNRIFGTTDAGTDAAIRFVGCDDVVIRNNDIIGAHATTGTIENVTTAGLRCVIDNNRIVNQTADGNNKAIVLVATTTGIISNNRIAVIDSTSPAPVTAAGAYVSGNYTTGAAGVTASVLM
ncbi:MAG TPA: hypothetical protein VD994_08510 [Prosthecobacter sp.]|nr:hypothetical protein [Prosthecobacter sp.]